MGSSGGGGGRGGGRRGGAAGGGGQIGDPTGGSVAAFGGRVQQIANAIPAVQRFGDKAFIDDVHAEFQRQFGPISRSEFENLLLEANRQDVITLSRADLPSAIDAQFGAGSVARSRVFSTPSAARENDITRTVHFVRVN